MKSRNKRSVKTLTAVAKQRSLELDISKADALRAKKIEENVHNSLQKITSDITGLEGSLRESLVMSSSFSVQSLMMQRSYIAERHNELGNIKNKYESARKLSDKMSDEVKSKNQKLELVNRIKERKQEVIKKTVMRDTSAAIDEVCTQKGIRK